MFEIVYLDHRTELHTFQEAVAICSDPAKAGFVMDVLTDNKGLQKFLRALIDKY